MGAEQSTAVEEDRNAELQSLVDLVIPDAHGKRAFDLDARDISSHSTIDVTKENVDEDRGLKGVATDIVVNDMFATEDTLFRFMKVVYGTFTRALAMYRQRRGLTHPQLFFVYKGGNILRIISKEFLLELPAQASREIVDFYSQFFRRSDSDFSIYVDPRIDNYDEVFHETTLLAYLLQYDIRHRFDESLPEYFSLFRYIPSYQSTILHPYIDKFNERRPEGDNDPFVNFRIGEAIADPTGRRFAYRANDDTTMVFYDLDEDWLTPVRKAAVGVITAPPRGTTMTITHNNTLDFAAQDIRVKFNLTRTKFIFTLLRASGKTKNVGGELIDVSVPHRDSSTLMHFYDDLQNNIASYTLRYQNGQPPLRFNSYALSYLAHDLEYILFDVAPYPWLDAKYQKRLNRLFYLYFVNLSIALENATEKLQVLRDAREMVFKRLSQPEQARRGIARFLVKYKSKPLYIKSLIVELDKLIDRVDADPAQVSELVAMGEVLLQNTDFIMGAIENVRQYCSRDSGGSARERDLYTVEVGNLV